MMSEKVKLTIDGVAIEADQGQKILFAALKNEIYIPHLCAVESESRPNAGCRLCFVEIEGGRKPVTACTKEVSEGMVVRTRSERIDRLVKTAFELIISDHNLKCRGCPANRQCSLQKIARSRGFKLRHERFQPLDKSYPLDDSDAKIALDRSRCVLCGLCIHADRQHDGKGVLGFSGRGIDRIITTFNDKPLQEVSCDKCDHLVEACPVGALFYKQEA